MTELVVATGNAGKLRELDELLGPLGWTTVGQKALGVTGPKETGQTFVENALLKARSAATATGRPALADDSGLAVTALEGAPGIYSSRFAGAEADDAANNAELLRRLTGVPDEQRTAFFYCCLVLLRHPDDPTPVIAEGRWWGRIGHEPAGANGFGYDPLFVLPDRGITSAQLPPEEKQHLSHRGQAMTALRQRLAAGW